MEAWSRWPVSVSCVRVLRPSPTSESCVRVLRPIGPTSTPNAAAGGLSRRGWRNRARNGPGGHGMARAVTEWPGRSRNGPAGPRNGRIEAAAPPPAQTSRPFTPGRSAQRGDQEPVEHVEFLEHRPPPMTTDSSGFSATTISIPVSAARRASSPWSSAPPPVSTMPWNMMSAANSRGCQIQGGCDGVDDGRHLLLYGLADVLAGGDHGLGQAGDQIPAPNLGVGLVLLDAGRTRVPS